MIRKPASRRRRVIRRIGLVALLAGVLAAVGFVVWAQSPMRAEAAPLAAVRADSAITYRDRGVAVVLPPKQVTRGRLPLTGPSAAHRTVRTVVSAAVGPGSGYPRGPGGG